MIHGAALRLRPKMMTVVTIIAGLLPIMWSQGTGSEVMQRIAAPMIGGMVTALVLTLLVLPAAYYPGAAATCLLINNPNDPISQPFSTERLKENTMNYKTLTLTLLLGLATHTSLQAGEMMNHQGHDMARMEGMNHEGHDMAAMQTEQTLTKGVISRIDAPKGKVGIKHEAITNLKMPP